MKKEQIDKIGFGIIILTIILLNIFIGSNIKQPIWIIQAIVSIYTIIYLIIGKINKNDKLIIKNRIDIAVLLFMISTTIPLLLGKQISLDGSVNFILKYWAVYGFYILIKNIITNEKRRDILINTIIISSLIPIIIGYDMLTFNNFEKIIDLLNLVKIKDSRMISTFGYANTYAIYLGITTSLAIYKFLKSDKKKKILYGIYIGIGAITILLTQSKAVLALYALIILGFAIKGIKDKKISKKWIIVGIGAMVIFFIYFFISIQISKTLKVTDENKTCVIRGIEKNTQYEFSLDIDAKTEKQYNTFNITIVEVTKYFSEVELATDKFAEFQGTKTYNFKTDNDADHIEIKIKNELKEDITINELRINGEKYILEYKYIPDEIVRIFTTFNFKNSSVWQRGDYWKDALNIIKNRSGIIGAGGNTWRYLYGQEQEYSYYAKEAHCYILELFMSFGLFGLLCYIVIIAITIQSVINLIKNHKANIALIIGLGILVLHSLMDFDMSFLIMEMYFYMLIALLNSDDTELKKNTNIAEIGVTVILAIIAIANGLGFASQILETDSENITSRITPWISRYQYNKIVYIANNKIDDSKKMQYIKNYVANEPYQNQNVMYEIFCDEIINTNVENKDDITYIIDIWKKINVERKFESDTIQKRSEIMLKLAKYLNEKDEYKEQACQIAQIIVDEYMKQNKNVINYKRNRETETMARFKYKYYTDVYENAKKILDE